MLHTLPPPYLPPAIVSHLEVLCLQSSSTVCSSAGVYVEEGPDRDALTEALARENYLPVYLDPRTVGNPSLRLHYKPYLSHPPLRPPPPATRAHCMQMSCCTNQHQHPRSYLVSKQYHCSCRRASGSCLFKHASLHGHRSCSNQRQQRLSCTEQVEDRVQCIWTHQSKLSCCLSQVQ